MLTDAKRANFVVHPSTAPMSLEVEAAPDIHDPGHRRRPVRRYVDRYWAGLAAAPTGWRSGRATAGVDIPARVSCQEPTADPSAPPQPSAVHRTSGTNEMTLRAHCKAHARPR